MNWSQGVPLSKVAQGGNSNSFSICVLLGAGPARVTRCSSDEGFFFLAIWKPPDLDSSRNVLLKRWKLVGETSNSLGVGMEGALFTCSLAPLSIALPHSRTRGTGGSCGVSQEKDGRGRRRKCRLSPEKAILRTAASSSCGTRKCRGRVSSFNSQEPRKLLFWNSTASGGHPVGSKNCSRWSSVRQGFASDQFSRVVSKTLDRGNKIVRAFRVVAAGGGDEEDDVKDSFDGGLFRREKSALSPKKSSKRLPPPEQPRRGSGWVLYTAGTVAAAAAGVVAAKGIQSSNAHASVQSGGGDGQSFPPGSGGGDGGGGGGHGSGGSEGGGSIGFSDPSQYSNTKEDEEKVPVSVRVSKKAPGTSAGAPVEEETAGRTRTLASLSSAAGDFGDGEAASGVNKSTPGIAIAPRGGAGGIKGPDFGSPAAPSGNRGQSQQNYAQDGEIGTSYLGGDSHYRPARHGNLREVPPEFSSIRGKITEIPGYGREGTGNVQQQQQQSSQRSDFTSWVGGLVHSMVGSRASGPKSNNDNQDLDEESKKSLVMEVAARTLQMIAEQPNETGLAKSSETGALRRLQRETFADLVKIRERLSKVEHHSGLTRASYTGHSGAAAAKTSLKGEVNSGAAFVLVDGLASNLSRYALEHAGLLTGLDVRFTFETIMRENDLLLTQCGVGQLPGESDGSTLGGSISLQKISYTAQINDTLSVSVSPTGSRACDMAESVNHLQGQALTSFAGSGPAIYKHCRGSSIGATLRSDSVLVSMGQYLSGWGSRAANATSSPLCLSTLAQIMIQPFEHMVFALSAVNNLWPSPPLPSSNGFHWSEMGPLVLSKMVTRPTHPTGTFAFNDLPSSSTASFLSQGHLPERDSWSLDAESRGPGGSSGTAMQSVAFAGELDLGGHVSLGGWAQVERADWLEELEKKDFQWNLSLAKSTGSNVNWGLSVGRRKREDWSGDDGSASPHSGPHLETPLSHVQMEAFVKLTVGRGFSLQPGLVYVLDKDTQTPAFMVRSSWTL